MLARIAAGLLGIGLAALAAMSAEAQDAKPSAAQVAAIRGCIAKNKEGDAAEQCILRLVATPCTNRPQAKSTIAMADCYRVEHDIWETVLAENLKALTADLDDQQKAKLKAMQDAWATSRERTCAFYYDKIQGTMATISTAACLAQETARRALLIRDFRGL